MYVCMYVCMYVVNDCTVCALFDDIQTIMNHFSKSCNQLNFTYFGSPLSADSTIASEVPSRLAKASSAFGKVSKKLWKRHDISKKGSRLKWMCTRQLSYRLYCMPVKHSAFYVVILKKLTVFKWDVFVRSAISNVRIQFRHEVLSRAGVCGPEFYLLHVIRMPDLRISNSFLYGQLQGNRYQDDPK